MTSMRSMFEDCAAMNGTIEEWDVSNVEDMSLMVRVRVCGFFFFCTSGRHAMDSRVLFM